MCLEHLLQLQQKQEEIEEAGAVSVAVSVESAEKGATLVKQKDLVYPVLTDPEFAATDAYKVRAADEGYSLPALFLIGKDGDVLFGRVGVAHGPFGHGVLDEALSALRSLDGEEEVDATAPESNGEA